MALAANSSCAKYYWQNRGKAPAGYVKGMALAYARSLCKPSVLPSLGSTDKDALAYYGLSASPLNTYTLLMGLGLSESSGKYCEGYDLSASTHTESGAEAGLFQFSYDSIGASSELAKIVDFYKANPDKCLLEVFKEGVSCRAQSLIGSGEGMRFQKLSKECPAFAVEYGALLIRVLRRHFGPIIRKEAQFRDECREMFKAVESQVSCGPSPSPSITPKIDVPALKKVFVVVFENTGYSATIVRPAFKAQAEKGALMTNLFALAHDSQPNYIAMIGGSLLGVSSNSNVDLGAKSIVDLLEAKGLSWKAYQENYPGNCFKGSSGSYVRKHNPFISFTSISANPVRCAKIVNATQLDADLAADSLPNFSFYTPNLNNDGHDTSIYYADTFLGNLVKKLENQKDLLFIVTMDEDEGGSNHIFTSLSGPMVRAGAKLDNPLNHYSVLRTIEDGFRLGTLELKDKEASPILGIWK